RHVHPRPDRRGRRDRIGDDARAPPRRGRAMSPPAMAAAFAVGLLVAIVLFVVVATYNDVVALQRRIDKAWANIEVALQQRHDQLPALVDAVRGLMTFERDVLTRVTAARAAWSPEAPIPAQAATAAETTRAVRSLFATVERYQIG